MSECSLCIRQQFSSRYFCRNFLRNNQRARFRCLSSRRMGFACPSWLLGCLTVVALDVSIEVVQRRTLRFARVATFFALPPGDVVLGTLMVFTLNEQGPLPIMLHFNASPASCGLSVVMPHLHFVAVMVTGPPSAIPVANPADVIDAIEESELLQTTDEVMSFPKLSMAVNCT
jgi:hypothetical protein